MDLKNLPELSREALSMLYDYLNKHREHIDYARLQTTPTINPSPSLEAADVPELTD